MKAIEEDPILDKIIEELVCEHSCHTVILYGSRARGDSAATSDYDVIGIIRFGHKYRIARKYNGFYIDAFVYPEKFLGKTGEEFLHLKDGKVVYEKTRYGSRLLKSINTASKKEYVPLPKDEIAARRVWLHKMYERSLIGDMEGSYRRIWLQSALLYEYFHLRKKRYSGCKLSLEWLKKNDSSTHKLFAKLLTEPSNQKALKRLVERVSQRPLA
ncbi:MAG: hypothetical protein COT74_07120 [Bdellovibrionales bacterium CG10_big_fil_rev_8_21_14_0_10_45_34]|nr:MAG: hypothetical protein COT74_07120 [Bdellovibrionales bacterium CG10_big_fil_rev_8_21_14_0_10_45_34]